MKVKVSNVNQPIWTECNVYANLPVELSKLQEIAYNLWWCWNGDAKDLFRYIDLDAWHRAGSNPIVLMNTISYDRMVELTKDEKFMKQLNETYAEFRAYMDKPKDKKKPTIAYFSMEYGLTHILKIYSGGLGILAGDYIKEASDCNVDMTAIGFLYRYGYFTQTLSPEGQQIANYEAQNFSNLPITQVKEADGSNMVIEVPYPGRTVKAYLWKVAVGRMDLYLLDTDRMNAIAEELGMKKAPWWTTDFLVDYDDGSKTAFSVKYDRSAFDPNKRTYRGKESRLHNLVMRQRAEQIYWESQKVRFKLVTNEDINQVLVWNVKSVMSYYESFKVISKEQKLKYLIAHKYVYIPMDKQILDFHEIVERAGFDIDELYKRVLVARDLHEEITERREHNGRIKK